MAKISTKILRLSVDRQKKSSPFNFSSWVPEFFDFLDLVVNNDQNITFLMKSEKKITV